MEAMLRRYWPKWNGTMQERTGGWNNSTYFIYNEERSSVLRIYNTHSDHEKVEFEHTVLESLQQAQLNYRIPVPIKTETGETIVQLQDGSGKYACLFEYIEGTSPVEGCYPIAYSLGEAAGELSSVLAKIVPKVAPVYRPYYELLQAYPNCNPEYVLDFCEQPAKEFGDLYEELQIIRAAYEDICHSLAGIEKLPKQLVHGDLNVSNLLVDLEHTSEVTALLDFEFCTIDVRAMEAAVIITGLLGHDEEIEIVRRFCIAYATKTRLSSEEVAAIPHLMILRLVDVFLHFMSRFLNGTDEFNVLRQQVQMLAADLKKLEYSKSWMNEELSKLMGEACLSE
nr:phosphotransferase [Paenibacillus segetis]